ncbi:uncharacterized protein C8A04DRAFT_29232 [Dichotomopilus funicola]|uniref:Protein kinase domain-containing protein n=1 Tax=Dichotomopilus funicola TaxID=1934379 RepID=A0AAN6V1N0_9PEZI|nr:hypothetical protein C8A04DRAFT_29232 [Dichotomopilus funicola]
MSRQHQDAPLRASRAVSQKNGTQDNKFQKNKNKKNNANTGTTTSTGTSTSTSTNKRHISDVSFGQLFCDEADQCLTILPLGRGHSAQTQLVHSTRLGESCVRKTLYYSAREPSMPREKYGRFKTILADEFDRDAKFAHELHAAAAGMGYPLRVPRVLGAGTKSTADGGKVSYWEPCNGGTLWGFLDRCRREGFVIPQGFALHILLQILETLDFFYTGLQKENLHANNIMLHFTPGQFVPEVRIIDFGQATHFPVGPGDPTNSLKRHGVVHWDIPNIVKLLEAHLIPQTLLRPAYHRVQVIASQQRLTLGCLVRSIILTNAVKKMNKLDEMKNADNNNNNDVDGQDPVVVDQQNNQRENGRGRNRPDLFKQYYAGIKRHYRHPTFPGQNQVPDEKLDPDLQAWHQRRACPDPLHVAFHMLNDLHQQFTDRMTEAILEATQPPNAKGLIDAFPVPSLRPIINFLRSVTPAQLRPVVTGRVRTDVGELSRFRELMLGPHGAKALERFGTTRRPIFPTLRELAEWLDENNLAAGVGLGGVSNPPPDATKSWGVAMIVRRRIPGDWVQLEIGRVLKARVCMDILKELYPNRNWDDDGDDDDDEETESEEEGDDDEEEYDDGEECDDEEEFDDEADMMDIDKPGDSGYAAVAKSDDSIL